ncbi:MAG: DUF3365 domain-containing protein [Gammaproteobacteria bacterium]|nr:DUF3365 domain-containing protein [Gammaproteobacteria bacterium]MCW8840360.1 DUF3365 domain-containing protein [Gammaproteobacteria bacterium]MCW8927311.1 DUF3365 domain-containing protein [Gammaproteobacteria bacterium]MCW8957532.1 DUF3365 domain-containing protein [Gammaproteobacteria bacterium]MCW8972769.1 DUF3365 domain-containing protein [Gammaproteobacteria bacterium]
MKKLISVALLCTLPMSVALAGQDEIKKRATDSKAVVKQFMGKLKGELGNAMKSGGPTKAIEVCNTVAPAIAQEQSDKHGWDVGRTSLKTRNPDNAPDAWETVVLKQFEERAASGENPAEMAHFEVVEQDGQKAFRFMKAIGMPPLDKAPCLKCHGENIDPAITAKLDELYPEDQARGYKPGMIRGAFTITQPME